MTEWWPVIDYPNYIANSDGEIYEVMPGGELIEVPKKMDDYGFQVVSLRKPSGQIHEEKVGNIIAYLFTECHAFDEEMPEDAWNPIKETMVQHFDGDLTNNAMSNIRWVDRDIDPDSEIRKEYISNLKKEREAVSPSRRGKQGKAVMCENLETGEVLRFETQKEAELYLGVKNITPVLTGKQKSAANHKIWRDE